MKIPISGAGLCFFILHPLRPLRSLRWKIKKKPNFPGEKVGVLEMQTVTRPSPRKDCKAHDESGRFPGLRLPTSHAFPDLSPVAETAKACFGFRVTGFGLWKTENYSLWTQNSKRATRNCLLWVSFRSQLRGSGRFALPSRAVSRNFKESGEIL